MKRRQFHLVFVKILLFSWLMVTISLKSAILYDTPVSNHGARIRLLIRLKGLEEKILIQDPQTIGGIRSEQYLNLNPQGKFPLLITEEEYPIPESDTIARYLIERYADREPKFYFRDNRLANCLSNEICRFHDLYISPIQGCMYRAPGSIFGSFGIDRGAALQELQRQLQAIETIIDNYRTRFSLKPLQDTSAFLCGEEISLADITLFPTMVFCDFMLPQFFHWKESEYKGPILSTWMENMCHSHPKVVRTREEILTALEGWKAKGRFLPIIKEQRYK